MSAKKKKQSKPSAEAVHIEGDAVVLPEVDSRAKSFSFFRKIVVSPVDQWAEIHLEFSSKDPKVLMIDIAEHAANLTVLREAGDIDHRFGKTCSRPALSQRYMHNLHPTTVVEHALMM